MQKRVLGIVTLALAAGVIYQFQIKPKNNPTVESAEATASPSKLSQQNPEAEQVPAVTPAADVDQLSRTVRDQTQSQEARRNALYVLTQMGSAALPALAAVATTPMPVATSQDPHSAEQMKQSFEAGLRVTAIEALDELGTDSSLSPAVKESMLSVLKVQKHRSLTLLAQISLSGIESGRPGKVKRAVDNLIQEK